MSALGALLGLILLLFLIVLVMRAVLEWTGVLTAGGEGGWAGRARDLSHRLTEPVIAPVRRVLKPVRIGDVQLDLASPELSHWATGFPTSTTGGIDSCGYERLRFERRDPGILLITGAGKAFSAGGDLEMVQRMAGVAVGAGAVVGLLDQSVCAARNSRSGS